MFIFMQRYSACPGGNVRVKPYNIENFDTPSENLTPNISLVTRANMTKRDPTVYLRGSAKSLSKDPQLCVSE